MTFYQKLEALLETKPENLGQGGGLLKTQIIHGVHTDNPALIELLLSDTAVKAEYFKDIGGALVFLKDKFLTALGDKDFLANSYTAYKNKIGLMDSEGLLKYRGEVVLNFPFKDCVLEGGQTSEDTKKNEIFFNETLAKDDIDRLLAPKAFCNIKHITKDGEAPLKAFSRLQKHGDITDNLLIKGNNLLALHSLKQRFAGKVKLIYIDPPYNTGNDGFRYNDSFNHSTWLVFMKNRLEIARELLREDGCILVQIDNSPSIWGAPELGYLLVLMDEIFGRQNYITNFVWKKKGNASNTASFGTLTESIVCYSKNITDTEFNMMPYERKYTYKDTQGEFNLVAPVKSNYGSYERKTMMFPIVIDGVTYLPPEGKRWTLSEKATDEIIATGKYKIDNGQFKIKKYHQDYILGNNKIFNNILETHGSLKTAKNHIETLGFDREEFDTPKPEELIEHLLSIFTNEGDIVLDFFAGSGTTAAVAHKMGRRWITIEQMDYIDSVTKARLIKVLEGEQGGVSKAQNWQGGGEFVYMELAPFNEVYKQKIIKAKTAEALLEIYTQMKEKAFLDYRLELIELSEDFASLPFDEQRRILADMLDKNQMYIPFTEIEDSSYGVSKEDIAISNQFYQI